MLTFLVVWCSVLTLPWVILAVWALRKDWYEDVIRRNTWTGAAHDARLAQVEIQALRQAFQQEAETGYTTKRERWIRGDTRYVSEWYQP